MVANVFLDGIAVGSVSGARVHENLGLSTGNSNWIRTFQGREFTRGGYHHALPSPPGPPDAISPGPLQGVVSLLSGFWPGLSP